MEIIQSRWNFYQILRQERMYFYEWACIKSRICWCWDFEPFVKLKVYLTTSNNKMMIHFSLEGKLTYPCWQNLIEFHFSPEASSIFVQIYVFKWAAVMVTPAVHWWRPFMLEMENSHSIKLAFLHGVCCLVPRKKSQLSLWVCSISATGFNRWFKNHKSSNYDGLLSNWSFITLYIQMIGAIWIKQDILNWSTPCMHCFIFMFLNYSQMNLCCIRKQATLTHIYCIWT